MKSSNQFTIYSLNDVVTGTTAPSNPYKGQLWVDTSTTPPITKVYDGSGWKEQNGTDEIKSNVKTITTKQSELKTSLDGLTSSVSAVVDKVDSHGEKIESLSSDMSSIIQKADEISAEVSNKVNSTYGNSSSSFGWKLTSSGFNVYSSAKTVVQINSSGLSVNGKITSTSGTIGGFTIGSTKLYSGKTAYKDDVNDGVYLGTDGIGLGANNNFYVDKTGYLYANNVDIQGKIYATEGNFDNCTINSTCSIYGYLYMSGSEQVKFHGKTTYNFNTTIGGSGIYAEIQSKKSSESTYRKTHSWIKPYGIIMLPDSQTNSDEGMIFGIMQTAGFNTQKLLSGSYYSYSWIGDDIYAQHACKYGDMFFILATYDSANSTNEVVFGNGSASNYMKGYWYLNETMYISDTNGSITRTYVGSTLYAALSGRWIVNDTLYFGEATTGYLTYTTVGSTKYPYLGGTFYASQLYFGTSTTGYQLRLDSDQITFYYGNSMKGELEGYSGYVDVQGTWKTNGSNWISSSDTRVKNSIEDYGEGYDLFFDLLKPRRYKFNEGTSGRYHTGFIAQETLEAIENSGLTTQDVAAFCRFDTEEGELGIRYEELISINTWQIQKLKQRIKILEDKLNEIN